MGIEQVKGNVDEAKIQAAKTEQERMSVDDNGSKEDTDKKYVVVDGPLGVAFTEGLNKLLSKESSVMQAVAMGQMEDYQKEIENPEIKAPYVYVFNAADGAMASKEHFEKIMAALKSGKYSEVRVVAEAKDGVSPVLDLVTESARKEGARLSVTSDMSKVFSIYGKR